MAMEMVNKEIMQLLPLTKVGGWAGQQQIRHQQVQHQQQHTPNTPLTRHHKPATITHHNNKNSQHAHTHARACTHNDAITHNTQ